MARAMFGSRTSRADRAGRVFDRTGSLDEVPEGYRLMNVSEVLKFLIKP